MKNLRIERVYFKEPTNIRTGNETRPERVVAHARYDLKIEGTHGVLVTSFDGFTTYVPMTNITSIVTLRDE